MEVVRLTLRKTDRKDFHRYVVFTDTELISLIICIILDVSEYMAVILLLPVIGDILDIAGFVACLVMFRE